MPSKTEPTWFNPEVANYIAARSAPPDKVLSELIERTREVTGDRAVMQVSPSQGALLTLLTRVTGTSRALEIGTFTGYSSICIARGLADGGHLLCCDVSEEYTTIARQAWADAEVDDRIELRIAPALETLAALPADSQFDLVFIDADKDNYLNYFEHVLPHLRSGGLMMVDNTLWSGSVVDENAEPGSVVATIREFNDAVAGDARVDSVILPVADGLTLIHKR
jgi:caffeoyl-CoA O-methyltransferase